MLPLERGSEPAGTLAACWEDVLALLRQQMTQATFDNCLRDTHPLGQQNGPSTRFASGHSTLRVAVRNELAKEWLDNRLRETVQRTLASVVGEAVPLEFVVVAPAQAPLVDGPLPRDSAPEPPPWAGSPLAHLDYPHLWNNTGFAKIHHYHNIFWRRYLGRAFELWLYLQARPLTKADLAFGWTPARKFRFRELARALRAGVNSVRGAEENCYYLRTTVEIGQPLASCCGRFAEAQWQAGPPPRCMHWRTGWLEILYKEGLLAVEEVKASGKSPRSHSLQVQVWRVLPLLTSWQVSRLSEPEQEQHERWLEKYGHLAGVTPDSWEAETAHSLVRSMTQPDYEAGRTLHGTYEPNTLAGKENMENIL